MNGTTLADFLREHQVWWTRKKSKTALFCHSGESRNPGFSRTSGPRLSPGWRLRGLFTKPSSLVSRKILEI